jgi:NAD-dependent DNA ligase
MKIYTLRPPTDINGKPICLFRNARENIRDKAIDQLTGICAGILSDGVVNEKEAEFFAEWVKTHTPFEPTWPFTDILSRLERIFADGKCDEEEREELRQIMAALSGKPEQAKPGVTYSTTLPFDDPPPSVVFTGRRFHVTGKFAYGSRTKVVKAIENKGGIGSDSMPTRDAHYLVVGIFASENWATSRFGRKIQRAVELRNNGAGIAIIGEEHWTKFLR